MSGTTTIDTAYSSCSSNIELVNDKLEAPMVKAEYWLDALGRKPVACILSGSARALFGTIQIVVAPFFIAFKLVQAAVYGCWCGREWAELSLNEAGWGCNYILHGVFNIMRGSVEATNIPAVIIMLRKCCGSDTNDFRLLPYHTENPDENSGFGLVSTSEIGDDEQLLYPDGVPATLDEGGGEPTTVDSDGEPALEEPSQL